MELFSSVPTGLEITQTTLRAAQAVRKGDGVIVQFKSEQPLPTGMIVRGALMQQPAFLEVLKKLVATLPMKSRTIMLCLPPESVACSWVLVPSPRGATDVSREIEKLLPQEQEDVQILTHPLGKQEGQDILCFAAASKEHAKQYVTLCEQAGLRVAGVTTGSAALTTASGVKHSSLMVRKSNENVILTVLRDGWTIDEEILSSGEPNVSDRVNALLKEYEGYGMKIADVSTVGVILKNIQSVPLLPWLVADDASFAGSIAASVASTSIPMNFLDFVGRKSNVSLISLGLLVLGVLAATVVLTIAVFSFFGSR